ncbi:hypothetical protein [Sphingomonas sp.]|uniref:hypothetical protein n=1 Tax=Sphingomonas sp. TaxID=28214 RepID=UPI0017B9840D|nr:hypothetical protein [Sphingomonas sp.]MBA3512697.1 hypothetical protein [Sphingomonas sp.]
MRTLITAVAVGALSLGVAACNNYDETNEAYANEANAADYADNAAGAGNYDTATTTGGSWPAGSRIVVENGVTYRLEPGGARVALGPNDSRIVVEDGVSYRVDPGGTRVRIDDTGAVVDVRPGGVDATVPVGGNTSVTVNTN